MCVYIYIYTYIYTTSSLAIHLLRDTSVDSISWLLWLMLQWTWVICFPNVELYEFSVYFWILTPYQKYHLKRKEISFENIFSHLVGSLFVLLTVSFPVQKLSSLI